MEHGDRREKGMDRKKDNSIDRSKCALISRIIGIKWKR